MERVSKRLTKEDGGGRFIPPASKLRFVRSGCTLLDCAMAGGWPLGRISNIIGDKSTGKTLLAIEAAANFAHDYPTGRIWYREAEAAFDEAYAESLGMPIKRVKFWPSDAAPFDTVEQFSDDLRSKSAFCEEKNIPGLYILDSLDALSDTKEMERKTGEATYGTGKARELSQMFRKLVRGVERARIAVLIISQVRDNIGVMFGRKTKRSGGRALDFYASIVLYLAHVETLKRTKSDDMPIGIRIKANCDKNKIGPAGRQCTFPIRFTYGVEDLTASLDWLDDKGKLAEVGLSEREKQKLLKRIDGMDIDEYEKLRKPISETVVRLWREHEQSLTVKRKKYQ